MALNQTRVVFNEFDNTDQEQTARSLIEWARPLFPSWLQVLYVCPDDPENDGDVAQVLTAPAYLQCTVKLFPNFFGESFEDQQRSIIHEISHCLDAPAWDVVLNQILPIIQRDNPDLATTLKEWFMAGVESANVERTRVLVNLLNKTGFNPNAFKDTRAQHNG